MNTQAINKYSQEIQEKILNTLRAYDEVHIIICDDGTYEVSPDLCLSSTSKLVAGECKLVKMECIEVGEVYDEHEQTINYINQFRTYPYNFKGVRDYKLINKLYENRDLQVIDIVDGKLVIND